MHNFLKFKVLKEDRNERQTDRHDPKQRRLVWTRF